MRKSLLAIAAVVILIATGCVESTSTSVNNAADEQLYKPVHYANSNIAGPKLVVLPGKIKSNSRVFKDKISTNNIADFAEIELSKANFGVLERSDLGPLLNEVELAVNMGNPSALKKFKRGKFKTTKWFIKFDVLRAEHIASANNSFDGAALGSIFGAFMGSREGAATSAAVGSVKVNESAGIWIVGMRYKILDASTSEQVSSGYVEKKMEANSEQSSVLGFGGGKKKLITLDSIVQRLVQEAVLEIDRQK